jgi:hypothetical protein
VVYFPLCAAFFISAQALDRHLLASVIHCFFISYPVSLIKMTIASSICKAVVATLILNGVALGYFEDHKRSVDAQDITARQIDIGGLDKLLNLPGGLNLDDILSGLGGVASTQQVAQVADGKDFKGIGI